MHFFHIIHGSRCQTSNEQTNAMQTSSQGHSPLAPAKKISNQCSIRDEAKGSSLSPKGENRSQVSAMGRASAPGKDTFVTGQRRLSQPVWVPCFLNHKHPQGRGPTPGLWSVRGPCPFLSAYSKQHTSLPHDPASADWLPCVTVVSTPKFDSETT